MIKNEEQEADEQQGDEGKKETLRKRRKIMKNFREYTVRQDTEGRFKGWSSRAAGDMAKLCKKIREGKEDYSRFREAYREIYSSRSKGKTKVILEAEVEVDYRELWDLGEIPLTEI